MPEPNQNRVILAAQKREESLKGTKMVQVGMSVREGLDQDGQYIIGSLGKGVNQSIHKLDQIRGQMPF